MPTRFAPHVFTLYWIAFTAHTKTRLSDFSMKSNGTELEQVFHTDRRSCRSGWTREFGNLNSSPRSWIFTSVPVDSSPHSYLFTSARVRIPVHTAPTCVAKTQTDMCGSTFEISEAQLHYVTETASKSLLLNVNGISIRLGFRVGHKSYLPGSRGIVWT